MLWSVFLDVLLLMLVVVVPFLLLSSIKYTRKLVGCLTAKKLTQDDDEQEGEQEDAEENNTKIAEETLESEKDLETVLEDVAVEFVEFKENEKKQKEDEKEDLNDGFEYWKRTFVDERKSKLSENEFSLATFMCFCCCFRCFARRSSLGEPAEEEEEEIPPVEGQVRLTMAFETKNVGLAEKLQISLRKLSEKEEDDDSAIPALLVVVVLVKIKNAWNSFLKLFFHMSGFRLTILNLFMITYQLILSGALNYVNCVEVRSGEFKLRSKGDVACFDVNWFLQFPFLFLIPIPFCVLFPLFVLGLLFFNRNRLFSDEIYSKSENKKFSEMYGIFYLSYRLNCWWYEPFSLLRRFTVVVLIAFSGTLPTLTDFSLGAALGLFLLFHIFVRPYRKSFDNFLEGAGLFSLLALQIVRMSSLFTEYNALALLVILVTLLPVLTLMLYLKYRLPLLFLLKHVEKFVVIRMAVPLVMFLEPVVVAMRSLCCIIPVDNSFRKSIASNSEDLEGDVEMEEVIEEEVLEDAKENQD